MTEKVENKPWQRVFINSDEKHVVAKYFRTKGLDGQYRIKGHVIESEALNNLESILSLSETDGIPNEVITFLHGYASKLSEYVADQEVAQPQGIPKPQEWFTAIIDEETYYKM